MTRDTQEGSHEEQLGKGAACVIAYVRHRMEDAIESRAVQGTTTGLDNHVLEMFESYARQWAELAAHAPTSDEKTAWVAGAAAAWTAFAAVALTPASEERTVRLSTACVPIDWND